MQVTNRTFPLVTIWFDASFLHLWEDREDREDNFRLHTRSIILAGALSRARAHTGMAFILPILPILP